MEVIYIAGKMSGLPDFGLEKFRKAVEMLRASGYVVLSPTMLPTGMPKDRYMPICLSLIDAADMVYALNNCDTSPGAAVELSYAAYQGKVIWRETMEDMKP